MRTFDYEAMIAIEKGWSGDKKYCYFDQEDKKYLLRISPIEKSESRKKLFDILIEVSKLDINMCRPVEFGICDEGVYTIHTWVNGVDAEEIIQSMDEQEQYAYGYESGKILKEIHSIRAPKDQQDWYERFNKKTNVKISKYQACELSFEGDHFIIDYIEKNRHLLKDRPQSFQHGDYHIGNMMIEEDVLTIIDFDRLDFGDPWEEFNRIVWCAQKSPHFATGQLDGYFDGDPPLEFFRLLAFYISSNTLSSIYWAIPFGQKEIDTMMKQSQEVLSWYDNMSNPIPTWYIKEYKKV